MYGLLERLRDEPAACTCEASFERNRLVVAAGGCPGDGALSTSPACRATAVRALRDRDIDAVYTRSRGVERRYDGRSAALLVAAGRFAERVAFRDDALAARAERDPLGAAHEASGRAGPVADAAAATGLVEVADAAADYANALRAYVGPPIARSRVDPVPPAGSLAAMRTLDTGATARIYDHDGDGMRTYHVEPPEHGLSPGGLGTLADAYDLLAAGAVGDGHRAPGRAVRRVADEEDPVEALADVLTKHTRGFGVLEDLFADAAVSDVFASAPVESNPIRVRVDGETMRTNVRLTPDGAAALASRLRRESGRPFSRASPALDAVVGDVGAADRLRVAAVTEPVSDGVGFAFRAHGADAWTLETLVANGTLPPEAAALLSLATERGVAVLLAGTRGAGKTTLLSALLWELPAATRVVVLEDTPELPVADLQRSGRDVQALRTTTVDADRGLSPTEALRTALRLGEGALVVGEVRGDEAHVLYEAMRVGAGGSAVLGTIHGDGGDAVRERVVSDLGVEASSFAETDLIVTLEPHDAPDGRRRRVSLVEEVVGTRDAVAVEPLYEYGPDGLTATGRIERGNSRLVAALARPAERYSDVLDALDARESDITALVDDARPADGSSTTTPDDPQRRR